MSKHTPEPWPELVREPYPEEGVSLLGRDYAHARICVNACAGINPAGVPGLVKGCVAALNYLKTGSMNPDAIADETMDLLGSERGALQAGLEAALELARKDNP